LSNDPEVWLEQVRLPPEKRSPWFDRGRYPSSGTVRDFYLDPTRTLEPLELRDVLRALLPDGSGPVGSDDRNLEHNLEGIVERLRRGEGTEYERRLVRSAFARVLHEPSAAPIPDLTWIIDLAFEHPNQAFEVAHAFLGTHFWVLPDQVIDGVFDFMATVRCHFRMSGFQEDEVGLLRSIAPRDLEYLAAALWRRMGYETTVTKRTRDGGKDVVARRSETGRAETVLIECRQWTDHIPVSAPREMVGVLYVERANKGVIVAPGGFAEGAGSASAFADEAKTVELVNGSQLATLMTEHYGPDWPQNLDRYIQNGRTIAGDGPASTPS
jgi:restriction system protein